MQETRSAEWRGAAWWLATEYSIECKPYTEIAAWLSLEWRRSAHFDTYTKYVSTYVRTDRTLLRSSVDALKDTTSAVLDVTQTLKPPLAHAAAPTIYLSYIIATTRALR